MKALKPITLITVFILLAGCASVDLTKTSQGFQEPTNPNTIEVLMTLPSRDYQELGSVTVAGFKANQEAKMHNALRSKSAPLGAHAVVLTDRGFTPGGIFSGPRLWATGVAIRYDE